MEDEKDDSKNDVTLMIEMARSAAKSEGDKTIHARMENAIARIRQAERASHPLYPYRYWIVAMASELPKPGRVTAIKSMLDDTGISLDEAQSSTRSLGRWLKRTMSEVMIEIETSKSTKKGKNDE